MIIRTYVKSDRSPCENHEKISLVNITFGLLARAILYAKYVYVRSKPVSIANGIVKGALLCDMLGHRWSFKRPAISVLLDIKASFDSAGPALLWHWFLLKSRPRKFISLSQTTEAAFVFTEMFQLS